MIGWAELEWLYVYTCVKAGDGGVFMNFFFYLMHYVIVGLVVVLYGLYCLWYVISVGSMV